MVIRRYLEKNLSATEQELNLRRSDNRVRMAYLWAVGDSWEHAIKLRSVVRVTIRDLKIYDCDVDENVTSK